MNYTLTLIQEPILIMIPKLLYLLREGQKYIFRLVMRVKNKKILYRLKEVNKWFIVRVG